MNKIRHTYPRTSHDEQVERFGEQPNGKLAEAVLARHHKVAEIMNRHLQEIEAEVLKLDPERAAARLSRALLRRLRAGSRRPSHRGSMPCAPKPGGRCRGVAPCQRNSSGDGRDPPCPDEW
jgi:hypothetical protein